MRDQYAIVFSFASDWLREWTNQKAKKCKTNAIPDLFRHSIKIAVKIAVKVKHIFNITEFIRSATSCASKGEIEDAELLVLSWVHSQSEKFIRSLSGIEGLGQSRLQRALRDTLKELPSISKKFDHSCEPNTIYVHNDAVATLAHSPPRESFCRELGISGSLVFVKACLGLLCQSQNLNDLREYLVGNPVSLQALFQWLLD